MSSTALKLRYRSLEQARGHCQQLKTGRIFIPTEMPLPVNTALNLALVLPDRGGAISVAVQVIESLDREQAAAAQKPCGMLFALVGDNTAAIEKLEQALAAGGAAGAQTTPAEAPPTQSPPGPDRAVPGPETPPTPPAAAAPAAETPLPGAGAAAAESAELSMDWIRTAVDQPEAICEAEPPVAAAPAAAEKKDLTPAERERIKPAGEFVMDLTKAMLRTGYYAPDHPGSHNAKHGLYEAFLKCMRDSAEIMITSQAARGKTDILITGILEEPVNVRLLVGAGMAELFVPKLSDYFSRKGLVSFAIKKTITPAHFDGFVNIMSDPKADQGENAQIGSILTAALVERGISEISTVFVDDIIVLEKNIPWRVEMAIQRLAKDLKVLPMFQGQSDEAIKRMKLEIIHDILRPLKQPGHLKDFIINCYVITQHVKTIQEEDIEQIIVAAFPLHALLPTSQHIFKELSRLREIGAKDPENPALKRRFAGVKRILQLMSRRIVHTDIRGAQRILEELYTSGVLSFEELPADVQYLVNTQKIVQDVLRHQRAYLLRLLRPESPGDGAILLKCFRRIIAPLLEQGELPLVLQTAAAVRKATEKGLLPAGSASDPGGIHFLFKDRARELEAAYERADDEQRRRIGSLLAMLDGFGIEILCKVLADSDNRGARKAAMNALIQKGDLARAWVLAVLEDPTQKWYLKRNGLMLLRHLARTEADIELARKHTSHTHGRVRDEALNVIVSLRTADAERIAFKALEDADEKIRWRAANALAELSPLSPETMERLLTRLRAEPPADKEQAARHLRKVTQLLRTIGSMKAFKEPEAVEAAVLEVARQAAGEKKGLLQRWRKDSAKEDSALLGAAIAALGAIGSERSEAFLAGLAGGKSPHTEAAAKALEALRAARSTREDAGAKPAS